MLIGISAAKQQSTVVQYLCDVQGFKSLTMAQLEAGAAMTERAVVVLRSEDDAELVRWSSGFVVHIDRWEAGAGLVLAPLEADPEVDIRLISSAADDVVEQMAWVVAWEEADKDESYSAYLYWAGHMDQGADDAAARCWG